MVYLLEVIKCHPDRFSEKARSGLESQKQTLDKKKNRNRPLHRPKNGQKTVPEREKEIIKKN